MHYIHNLHFFTKVFCNFSYSVEPLSFVRTYSFEKKHKNNLCSFLLSFGDMKNHGLLATFQFLFCIAAHER